jgi:hypothetical protein
MMREKQPSGPTMVALHALFRSPRPASLAAVAVSLVTSLVLLFLHGNLSGPGDELVYHAQAAQLIPFTHHYYGPSYFVALRLVHDSGLDWFTAGKVISWLSACVFLALSWLLLKRVLGEDHLAWPALALIALSPLFISESYTSKTMMYGAVWSLAAITMTTNPKSDRLSHWLLCGLVFGLAGLARFQNYAVLIGSVFGVWVLPNRMLRDRVNAVLGLMIGAALPPMLWNSYLLWVQGFVPANYNFIHLTTALGQFRSFFEVPELIARYGSVWGVISSHWSVAPRILLFAVKEAIKFPFGIGFAILFLAAGWLLPGFLSVTLQRRFHGPWLAAFLTGLFLTGLGSRGWLDYYVGFLPFLIVLVVVGIETLGRSEVAKMGLISWLVVILSTIVWSPIIVRQSFHSINWVEVDQARAFIEAERDDKTVVSTTARSFRYGTTVPFVRQNDIMRPDETPLLVERLRQHHITHFITERHTLYVFPDLAYLLQDAVPNTPAGLRRELLITTPLRLAVYRVLAP